MRTYRHMYEEIISDENIEEAIKEACKSRKKCRRKRRKLEALKNRPDRIMHVRGWIENYKPMKRIPHEIYDGIARKKRAIYVPSVRETVVQHAVVRVLDRHLMTGIYEHTYAAIKRRGQHKAKEAVERFIRRNPRSVKYYLKMDIRQYFPSVPQKKLMDMLERQIRDKRTLDLIRMILAACDEGIPLGYYISQWFANFYLRDFDHRVKDKAGKDLYIRWMDDMVIFSGNKRKLRGIREFVKEELKKLGLELKGNWRIQRFDHQRGGCFLDFMGFRFYRNRTTLRRSIYFRMMRKAGRIAKKEKPSIYELRQFLSYLGWIKHTDTYRSYRENIKPSVSIQNIKRRMSRHDRKERAHDIQTHGGEPAGTAA